MTTQPFLHHCNKISITYRHSTVSLIDGPGAGVDHGSAGLVEPVAKLGISLVHVVGVRIASVQLDIVNVPTGECVRVLLQLVTLAQFPSHTFMAWSRGDVMKKKNKFER